MRQQQVISAHLLTSTLRMGEPVVDSSSTRARAAADTAAMPDTDSASADASVDVAEAGGVAPLGVALGPGDPAPLPSPLSAEPPLYAYKQVIVALVLLAGAAILAAPFTPHGGALLYYLVAFACLNVLNAVGQAARMVDATRRIRARVVPRAPTAAAAAGAGAADAAVALKELRAASEVEDARLLRRVHGGGSGGGGLSSGAAPPAWRHVFVVPNYNEELGVLHATLDRLASHAHAQRYTVLLAMEAKEAGAVAKAAALQERYCARFKAVLFAVHTLNPATEMPGKASNVNSAVRQFAATVPPAERARYMLTVMDADALVPQQYVEGVEEAAAADGGAGAELHVYAAPVLFEQNGDAVPALVRMTDFTWGALAMQNLNSWTGVGFPISNYSVSLHLAASVDFWDTWPDAIGEDMHMFIKAYAKTRGAARLHPIFAPINMGHVNADGALASCVARYTQAERHMRGIADTAYALREAVGTRALPAAWRTLVLLFACCEAHLVALVSLMAFIFVPLYYGLLGVAHVKGVHDHALPRAILDNLGRANLALVVLILACHEVVRAACRRHLYGLAAPAIPRTAHGAIVHVASYLWLFLGVYFYTILPLLVTVLKHMLNIKSTNYVVAAKRGGGGGAPVAAAPAGGGKVGGGAAALSPAGAKLAAVGGSLDNSHGPGLPVSVVA